MGDGLILSTIHVYVIREGFLYYSLEAGQKDLIFTSMTTL